jgi:glycosyltransferase involved in cell wall biosynthesis
MLPGPLGPKLRIHRKVRGILVDFAPESILFHGLCGWELLTVADYARDNPSVLLYADCHADWNNSARSFLSREILHKRFYRGIIQKALPRLRKVLCTTPGVMDFVEEVYRVPRERLELFPLAGHPVSDETYVRARARARARHGIEDDQILFVQSGKQTRRKKLLESLRAFAQVSAPGFRLVIAGSLFDDIRSEAEALIAADPRVSFAGWQSVEELNDLLCGADVYLQPGTQSVTMQNSICARCAVVIDDVPSHRIHHDGNGWLINPDHPLEAILREISDNPERLGPMGEASYQIAKDRLDYAVLAERVLS